MMGKSSLCKSGQVNYCGPSAILLAARPTRQIAGTWAKRLGVLKKFNYLMSGRPARLRRSGQHANSVTKNGDHHAVVVGYLGIIKTCCKHPVPSLVCMSQETEKGSMVVYAYHLAMTFIGCRLRLDLVHLRWVICRCDGAVFEAKARTDSTGARWWCVV